MKKLTLNLLVFYLIITGCVSTDGKEFPKSFSVWVTNSMTEHRSSTMVFVPIKDILIKAPDFNSKAFIVLDQAKEIPSQFANKDVEFQGIVVVLGNLKANESRQLTVRFNPKGESLRSYPKLTQAELSHKVNGEWKNREYIGGEFKNVDFLRVPPEHKDHSWFIRYEGPGWESDKVGYRFYLDQRNAMDVYGKKVTEPVLQKVGLDGFDSYHEMQDWGMDVMKVGKSLGIGSLGMMVNNNAIRVEVTDSLTSRILENGVAYSSILTNYFGWKTKLDTIDVEARLTIHSGSRLTHQLINLTKDSDQLCSGLVKDQNGKRYTKEPTKQTYGYIATYGAQSLNNDNLGIAVLVSPSNFVAFSEDQFSHIIKLKSLDGKLDYYFLAAWEGEPGGIKNEEEFLKYLDKVATELSSPAKVEIK